ncbi:hypothetical protein Tco_1011521, partial [Tanacetum coccineum]
TAVDKIYAHESLTFNNTVAYEVISKWKAGLEDNMDALSDVYVLSNDDMVFLADARLRSWLPRVLQREVGTDFVGGTLHTVVGGSLSGDCDEEKNGSLKANLQHMEALSTT